MNYTNTTIENTNETIYYLPLICLIIFGITIIISILSISFPDTFVKICRLKKNKVNSYDNIITYNNPEYHYTEIYFDDINKNCTICQNKLVKGDDIYVTDCKHYFHKDCINKWFENSYNCPICRNFVYDIYDVNLI